MADAKLSKRQKKALAFKERHSKKKKQEFTEEQAVPVSDVVEDHDGAETEESLDNKKRKRQEEEEQQPEKEETQVTEEHENKPKKRRRRGKKSTDSGDQATQKKRYIVFVGNIPFDATKEELAQHFATVGCVPSVRLLTDKETKKPKGFAFVEFENAEQLSAALRLHRSKFKKRPINVELTAGGGGKSETRLEKLREKNSRLQKERKKNMRSKTKTKKETSSYAAQEVNEEDN